MRQIGLPPKRTRGGPRGDSPSCSHRTLSIPSNSSADSLELSWEISAVEHCCAALVACKQKHVKCRAHNFLEPVGTDIPVSQAPSVLGFETGREALGLCLTSDYSPNCREPCGFSHAVLSFFSIASLPVVGRILKCSPPP